MFDPIQPDWGEGEEVVRRDERTNRSKDRTPDRQTDGQTGMDGWMDGWMDTEINYFAAVYLLILWTHNS